MNRFNPISNIKPKKSAQQNETVKEEAVVINIEDIVDKLNKPQGINGEVGNNENANYRLKKIIKLIDPEISSILVDKLLDRFQSISGAIFSDADQLDSYCHDKKLVEIIQLLKHFVDDVLKDRFYGKNIISKIDEVLDYWQVTIGGLNYECFAIMYIDQSGNVLHSEKTTNSFATKVSIDKKNIILSATTLKASKLVILHNHPSQNTTPSNDDIEITNELVKLLSSIDVYLLDHIIVSSKDFFSFKKNNLL